MRYSRNARRPNKKYPKGPIKHYVAYKPCLEPHLFCDVQEKGVLQDMYPFGLRYKEDDIGYYTIRGYLEVDIT